MTLDDIQVIAALAGITVGPAHLKIADYTFTETLSGEWYWALKSSNPWLITYEVTFIMEGPQMPELQRALRKWYGRECPMPGED